MLRPQGAGLCATDSCCERRRPNDVAVIAQLSRGWPPPWPPLGTQRSMKCSPALPRIPLCSFRAQCCQLSSRQNCLWAHPLGCIVHWEQHSALAGPMSAADSHCRDPNEPLCQWLLVQHCHWAHPHSSHACQPLCPVRPAAPRPAAAGGGPAGRRGQVGQARAGSGRASADGSTAAGQTGAAAKKACDAPSSSGGTASRPDRRPSTPRAVRRHRPQAESVAHVELGMLLLH